ncbi:Pectinesterase [Bertholletia excelsa]
MMLPVILKLFLLILFFKSTNSSSGPNANGLLLVEEAHRNWVALMGSSNHSHFMTAENKLEPCKTIKVNKRKKLGDFVSVQAAIDSVLEGNLCRVVISVGRGIYKEKVYVPVTKPYICLEGEGAGKTIIVWHDTADRKGSDGKPLGTYGSATVAIDSPYFIAKNITFKNKAKTPQSGAQGKQAVALRISADNAAFISCKFIGAQDTLYDHRGRHYFKNCYIQGSVDFIFGDGLSLYQRCHLHAKTVSFGALTAQKRESLLEETGFSFVNCKVTGSGALYLGRAWGNFSRVVFAYTYMDKIVMPKGWNDWGDKNREMTVFYGQFECWGPGADYGGRVPWSRELTKQEAKPFISLSFIDGHDWLPLS